MEEDIKILENYIEWVKKEGIEVCGMEKELPALENLINRNKELEEELNSVKEIYYTQKDIETDYISKSKIKEKIEGLKPRIEQYEEYSKKRMETDVEFYENIADTAIVQVLEELLQE